MSTRDIYLSENNIDFLYRDVRDQVSRKQNYDLDSSQKYKNSFRGMMEKVYQNSDSSISNNLASLNRLTTQKIANYFFDQLSKKKSSQSNNLMDRPMKVSGNTSEKEIGNRLDNLMNQRMDNTPKPHNPNPIGLSTIPVQDLESVKGETNKKYQELLASRKDVLPNATNKVSSEPAPLQPPPQPSQPSKNSNMTLNIKPNDGDFNILPFTISDDFTDQTNNPGQPLYINMDQLSDSTGERVSFKYEDLQKKRNMEIQEFLNYQQTVENNSVVHNPQEIREGFATKKPSSTSTTVTENFTNSSSSNDANINKVVSDYLGERTGIEHINAMRNPLSVNRTDVFANISSLHNQHNEINNNVDNVNNINSNNTNNPDFAKSVYDFLLTQMKVSQREYQDVPYYFVVSSEDRQWENNAENRYNFLVNFRPTDTQMGVGIDTLYKNVVSVEVVKVIFPHDRLSVPFDNRIYLDLQSYPFLIMDIDELDGVFKGSNNTLNEAFALLLFDKAYDSEVLTNDQILNSIPTPADNIFKRFDRQFKRGFMSFCPFLFEKKKYPNTPLASLNRMTIRFYRPDGQLISVDNDHLDISNVESVVLADHELKLTTGFPGSTTGSYIKITTSTYFSNRTFRVGDLIKIKNYKADPSITDQNKLKFVEYINRKQGHIIINLESEVSTTASSNEGYINTIYISPAGEIDYKTGSLNATTYNDSVLGVGEVDTYGSLINSSMQVHITFKIVTREDKTTAVINPINV
jgi:hypothetical protein